MVIALDATYSISPEPSGIAVYSRQLVKALKSQHPEDEFLEAYRWKQWRSTWRNGGRLLLPPLPTFRSQLFHALNQRVDGKPAKRIVSTFHDLFVITAEYSSPEFRARFTQQAKQAAQRSDVIIAVSAFTARQVQSLLNVDASRIRVVPHGVQFPPGTITRAKAKTVLFVGALQKRKNIARLIDAFAVLPPDWKLILAGSPRGYGAPEIMQHLDACPYKGRVELTGYVGQDELERLYSEASIFAFPSLDEGFGMPVLEAMVRGLPVITSDCSALAEVAGDAALTVDPSNTDALASALLRLATDEGERERLIAAGRAHAASYTWERCSQETYRVYREVV